MSDPGCPAVRAIVAGHGDFAAGLVSAVQAITGRGSDLMPLAVPRLSAEDIERLFRESMERTGARVIFTDLQAGSCTMAARRLLRGMDGAVLVCGTNLPILLDFVMGDADDPAVAARRATERGRAAISLVEQRP
jgi:mannose/fructose-specific phosphotransferase system component IIA